MGPDRLSREAAERVLRRAVELGDQPGSVDDSFDVAALVAAVGDLGVPPTAVQRALAEEEAGLLGAEQGRLDRLAGPGTISVGRVVRSDAVTALGLTDEWLRRQWAFKRVRTGDTVAVYRRRTDMVASMQRTARSMSGKENAEKVRNLQVVVRDLAPSTSVVALAVDLESSKAFAEMGAGVVAGGGALMSTVGAIAGDLAGWAHLWPLLGIPASAGAGIGVLVARRAWTGGIDLALEGLLDRVEAGEQPPSVMGGITGRLFGTPVSSQRPSQPEPHSSHDSGGAPVAGTGDRMTGERFGRPGHGALRHEPPGRGAPDHGAPDHGAPGEGLSRPG